MGGASTRFPAPISRAALQYGVVYSRPVYLHRLQTPQPFTCLVYGALPEHDVLSKDVGLAGTVSAHIAAGRDAFGTPCSHAWPLARLLLHGTLASQLVSVGQFTRRQLFGTTTSLCDDVWRYLQHCLRLRPRRGGQLRRSHGSAVVLSREIDRQCSLAISQRRGRRDAARSRGRMTGEMRIGRGQVPVSACAIA